MVIKKEIDTICIEFGEQCKITTPSVFRWDTGQKLQFVDVPDGTEVQFEGDVGNLRVTNGQVEIPGILLQFSDLAETEGDEIIGYIRAYIRVIGEDSETTKKVLEIPVRNKPKPPDYVEPEEEQTFRQYVEGVLTATKSIAEDVQTKAENGEYNGASAYEVAVQNGFEGTEEEWLASLNGKDGITNYPDLTNKPHINGVELKGSKSTSDLKITRDYGDIEHLVSTLNRAKSDYFANYTTLRCRGSSLDLWVAYVGGSASTYTYTTDEQFIADLKSKLTSGGLQVGYFYLMPVQALPQDLSGKADKTEALKNVQISLFGGGVRLEYADGTAKYDTISGFADLLSQIEEKATTEYVDGKINEIKVAQIVDVLPETGLDGVLYCVPKNEPDSNDLYDDYKYINGQWELIGTRQITIDLGEYVKKTDYAGEGTPGVVKTSDLYGISTYNGYIHTVAATEEDIEKLNSGAVLTANLYNPIVPNTLKFAVETLVGGKLDSLDTEDKSNYVSAINEVFKYAIANSKKEWKLLHTKTLTEDSGVILDYDDFDFGGQYEEIMIRFTATCSGVGANITIINKSYSPTSYWGVFGNPTVAANSVYEILLQNENLGDDIKSKVHLSRQNASTKSVAIFEFRKDTAITDITQLKVFLSGEKTFPVDTVISIYGKEA